MRMIVVSMGMIMVVVMIVIVVMWVPGVLFHYIVAPREGYRLENGEWP